MLRNELAQSWRAVEIRKALREVYRIEFLRHLRHHGEDRCAVVGKFRSHRSGHGQNEKFTLLAPEGKRCETKIHEVKDSRLCSLAPEASLFTP